MTIAQKLHAANEELFKAGERIRFLEDQVMKLEADKQKAAAQLDVERRKHFGEVASIRLQLFERHDVEGMTRPQLVSMVEQGIAQARRLGLVETEGLIAKHRNNCDDTDIEMMEGIIKTYQERIATIQRQRMAEAQRAAQQSKLDARPLSDKLDTKGKLKTTPWWDNYVSPFNPNPTANGFGKMDAVAKKVQDEVKARPNTMKDGESVSVHSQTEWGVYYTLKREGDVYSCTCPHWRHQIGHTNRRSCKHLMRYLGEDVEKNRITAPQPSCWCGILTIRGQCPDHTQRWSGDERCTCGRLFRFCKEEYATGRSPTQAYHVPTISGADTLARTTGKTINDR